MMRKVGLAPSLLSADFSDLRSAICLIEEKNCFAIHIDVMDGQFVPQISYGQPVIKSIRPLSSLPFDVHLMIEKPELQIESFVNVGADMITFHAEGNVHIHRTIEYIKSFGKRAGISIVPSTPVSAILEVLPMVDLVLVMTVNPGFGGQKLIPSCVKKITELSKIKNEQNLSYIISVDGGINNSTARSVIDAGATLLVSGSAFFSGEFDLEKI